MRTVFNGYTESVVIFFTLSKSVLLYGGLQLLQNFLLDLGNIQIDSCSFHGSILPVLVEGLVEGFGVYREQRLVGCCSLERQAIALRLFLD